MFSSKFSNNILLLLSSVLLCYCSSLNMSTLRISFEVQTPQTPQPPIFPVLQIFPVLPLSRSDVIKKKVKELNVTDVILASLMENQLYYCPTVQTCNVDIQPDRSLRGFPCCDRCKCSSDCIQEGSCCPDFFVNGNIETPPEVCVRAQFRKWNFNFGKDVRNTENSYYMKSKCLNNFKNKTVQDFCENIQPTPEDYPRFRSHIPVSSNVSGKVYRNIYCAICNFEKETGLIVWNADVHCNKKVSVFPESFQNLIHFIQKEDQCNIMYRQPIGLTIRPKECEWGEITECNQTGIMVSYNKTLDFGCQAYTSIYNGFYRNVHCFMCNQLTEPRITGCDFSKTTAPFDVAAFTALLDFQVLEGENRNAYVSSYDKEKRCEWNEEFDEYKDVCRPISCSEGYMLSNNTCKRVYDQEYVKSYEVYYRLTTTGHCLRDTTCIGSAITSLIIKTFEDTSQLRICRIDTIQDVGDSSCEAQGETNQTQLIIHLELTSMGGPHHVEGVLQQIISIQKTLPPRTCQNDTLNEVHLDIDSYDYGDFAAFGTKSVNREYISPITSNSLRFTTSASTYSNVWFCASPLRLVRVRSNMFCPQLALSKTEYNFTFVNNKACIEDIDFCFQSGYFTNNSDSVTVCKEHYFDHIVVLINRTHKVCPKSIMNTAKIITLTFISISIICLIVTLIIYCLYKELKTVPGQNNMLLATNLLVAQLLFLFGSGQHRLEIGCKSIGLFLHLFWLSTLFIMSSCTIHMVRVFVSFTKPPLSSGGDNGFVVVKYIIYSYTCSAFFVFVNIAVTLLNTDGKEIGYGAGCICYISTKLMVGVTFALPTGLIVLSNIILFIVVVVKIQRLPDVKSSTGKHGNLFLIYTKLSCLTGLTWIFGFLNELIPLEILSYLFIAFNAGQGVYIMLAFVCNKRVMKLIKSSCTGKKTEASQRYRALPRSKGTTTSTTSKESVTSGKTVPSVVIKTDGSLHDKKLENGDDNELHVITGCENEKGVTNTKSEQDNRRDDHAHKMDFDTRF